MWGTDGAVELGLLYVPKRQNLPNQDVSILSNSLESMKLITRTKISVSRLRSYSNRPYLCIGTYSTRGHCTFNGKQFFKAMGINLTDNPYANCCHQVVRGTHLEAKVSAFFSEKKQNIKFAKHLNLLFKYPEILIAHFIDSSHMLLGSGHQSKGFVQVVMLIPT